jgi:hypothetical protein
LAQDPTGAKQDSDALLHQAAALAGDLRRPGQWHALFTAQEINGWLACDVPHNHPQLFPAHATEPRVAIENNKAQVAFTWHKAGFSAVISLEAEIYLREINVVAVRIFHARVGLLPLPLAGLLADVTTAGREAGLQIDQQQIEGDPVLLVTIPCSDSQNKSRPADQLCLDSLEVSEGEIYLAGHTGRGQTTTSSAQRTETNPEQYPAAQVEKSNIQR